MGNTYHQADFVVPAGVTAPATYRGHNIDAGVDYARTLDFSPTTTFSFQTGSVLVDSGNRYYFRITGNVDSDKRLFRSWNLAVNYRRGVNFVDGFTGPTFSDSVTGGVGGPLTRRLSFNASVAYARGSIGFGQTGNNFASYRGTARIQRALPAGLAGYVEYFYYHNSFGTSVILVQGVVPRLDRQGVRAGVTWGFDLPLIGQKRRRPVP